MSQYHEMLTNAMRDYGRACNEMSRYRGMVDGIIQVSGEDSVPTDIVRNLGEAMIAAGSALRRSADAREMIMRESQSNPPTPGSDR
jgi:hypothetical protein